MSDHRPPPDQAPSLASIERLAGEAFERLPDAVRTACAGLAIRVADFPDDAVLDELGIEDPFELTGLYDGIAADRAVGDAPADPARRGLAVSPADPGGMDRAGRRRPFPARCACSGPRDRPPSRLVGRRHPPDRRLDGMSAASGARCFAAPWKPGIRPGHPQPRTEAPMILYPAIDLKDGQCVRLLRGDMAAATVFGDRSGGAGARLRRGRLPLAASRRPQRRLRRPRRSTAPPSRRSSRRWRSPFSSAAASATGRPSRAGSTAASPG